MVPQTLRKAFFIHFWVDMIFAIPLFLWPVWFMGLFGFSTIEPITARLVAAALFGIGGVSLIVRNASKEIFEALLKLKLIWSGFAVLGIGMGYLDGAPESALLFLGIFVLFFVTWLSFLMMLRKQSN